MFRADRVQERNRRCVIHGRGVADQADIVEARTGQRDRTDHGRAVDLDTRHIVQGGVAAFKDRSGRFIGRDGQIRIGQLACGLDGGLAFGFAGFLSRTYNEDVIHQEDHNDQAGCDKEIALIFAHENTAFQACFVALPGASSLARLTSALLTSPIRRDQSLSGVDARAMNT